MSRPPRTPRFRRLAARALLGAALLAGLATTARAARHVRTPDVRTPHVLSDRVAAHGTNAHRVQIGMDDQFLTLTGDGSTDLDCWVYDADDHLIASDTRASDACVLRTPGLGRHRLVVRNLGHVSNDYVVRTADH